MTYKIKVPEMYARYKWCQERFGRSFQEAPVGARDWNKMRWWRKGGYLCFRNEDDAIMFKLRWGDAGTK
jgi:hypothetical protein